MDSADTHWMGVRCFRLAFGLLTLTALSVEELCMLIPYGGGIKALSVRSLGAGLWPSHRCRGGSVV